MLRIDLKKIGRRFKNPWVFLCFSLCLLSFPVLIFSMTFGQENAPQRDDGLALSPAVIPMPIISQMRMSAASAFTVRSQCGNRLMEYGEECDDGNTESGDGCSSKCKRETSLVTVKLPVSQTDVTTAISSIAAISSAVADANSSSPSSAAAPNAVISQQAEASGMAPSSGGAKVQPSQEVTPPVVVEPEPQCRTDSQCSDNDKCNGEEKCVSGSCQAGTALSCADDGNVCTTESCDTASGCVSRSNSSPCNDLNSCTVNDACSGGACKGTAMTCPSGYACQSGACVCTNPTASVSGGGAVTVGQSGSFSISVSCGGGSGEEEAEAWQEPNWWDHLLGVTPAFADDTSDSAHAADLQGYQLTAEEQAYEAAGTSPSALTALANDGLIPLATQVGVTAYQGQLDEIKKENPAVKTATVLTNAKGEKEFTFTMDETAESTPAAERLETTLDARSLTRTQTASAVVSPVAALAPSINLSNSITKVSSAPASVSSPVVSATSVAPQTAASSESTVGTVSAISVSSVTVGVSTACTTGSLTGSGSSVSGSVKCNAPGECKVTLGVTANGKSIPGTVAFNCACDSQSQDQIENGCYPKCNTDEIRVGTTCQKCSGATPYFDSATKSCKQCTQSSHCTLPGVCYKDAMCSSEGTCTFTEIPGCKCTSSSNCAKDGDVCTTETCEQGACTTKAVSGCKKTCADAGYADSSGLTCPQQQTVTVTNNDTQETKQLTCYTNYSCPSGSSTNSCTDCYTETKYVCAAGKPQLSCFDCQSATWQTDSAACGATGTPKTGGSCSGASSGKNDVNGFACEYTATQNKTCSSGVSKKDGSLTADSRSVSCCTCSAISNPTNCIAMTCSASDVKRECIASCNGCNIVKTDSVCANPTGIDIL